MLEALSSHPAFDPSVPNKFGWTPLHLAAGIGHPSTVRLLLQWQATDPNAINEGQTALHLAATGGYSEAVGVLLECPVVDPNGRDGKGNTALHRAVAAKARQTVERLLEDPRVALQCANNADVTPIGLARANDPILEVLLADARVDPTLGEADGWTPLLMAAESGFSAIARRLLERVPDASRYAGDVLYFAAGTGDVPLARTLLDDDRVDPWVLTSRKVSPLHRAIRKGSREIVDLILAVRRPTTIDLDGLDVISAAAMSRDTLDILDRLLADGRFNPNVADGNGRTALHHATIRGNIEAVRRLVVDPAPIGMRLTRGTAGR